MDIRSASRNDRISHTRILFVNGRPYNGPLDNLIEATNVMEQHERQLGNSYRRNNRRGRPILGHSHSESQPRNVMEGLQLDPIPLDLLDSVLQDWRRERFENPDETEEQTCLRMMSRHTAPSQCVPDENNTSQPNVRAVPSYRASQEESLLTISTTSSEPSCYGSDSGSGTSSPTEM